MWTVPGGAQETGGPHMRDLRHPRHFTDDFERQTANPYNAGKPKREAMDEYDLGKCTVERWGESISATGSPRRAAQDKGVAREVGRHRQPEPSLPHHEGERPGQSTDGMLKAELVHRETFGTTRELRAKHPDYVRRYGNFRIHSTLSYRSPVEFSEAGLSLPELSTSV